MFKAGLGPPVVEQRNTGGQRPTLNKHLFTFAAIPLSEGLLDKAESNMLHTC